MTKATTTKSIPLADLSLEQLVQVSQGIGHEIEKLREQRLYLRAKIAERLEKGERTCTEPVDGDAAAPGAVLEVAAKG